jgi:cellulose biosynthesis protein BcsQ
MAVTDRSDKVQLLDITSLQKALNQLPFDADEASVSAIFVESLLGVLDFDTTERYREYKTGIGGRAVDFAARKNTNDDTFLQTRLNPSLLIEVKGRNISLSEDTPTHRMAKAQIEGYLLSPNCKTAEWGIVTNSKNIQLFRRHGRVIVPATANHSITQDNLLEIVDEIKNKIENTQKALSVCIYNKGGVGKTTTLINLAAILWKHNKKVLVVDFDSQADTTNSLKLLPNSICLSQALRDTRLNIRDAIVPFNVTSRSKEVHIFDVIPADPGLEEYTDSNIASEIERGVSRLKDLLSTLVYDYDYILIDCPTQWLFFSQSGVFASDVVLIPTKHNGLTSLHNAARVIEQFIPEIQQLRKDGAPKALPVFFNGEKITDPARVTANAAIGQLLERNKTLIPYFYPKAKKGHIDKTIFEIPAYASVASAAFSHLPAVFTNKTVSDHYDRLAKEYFLHG